MNSSPAAAPFLSRGVVFDLDDTLFPERDYAVSGFRAAGEWLAQRTGCGNFAAAATTRFERGERGRIFDGALADAGIAPVPELVSELVRAYRAHTPALALGPAEKTLLADLRAAGRKVGVITDGYLETQRKKIAALGLAPLVDAVVCSDVWGREAWKPSPRPFREMERLLGVSPAECVYVADNPAKDFLGARGAGWRSIRLRLPNREHSGAEPSAPAFVPDAEVASLGELRQRLLVSS